MPFCNLFMGRPSYYYNVLISTKLLRELPQNALYELRCGTIFGDVNVTVAVQGTKFIQ